MIRRLLHEHFFFYQLKVCFLVDLKLKEEKNRFFRGANFFFFFYRQGLVFERRRTTLAIGIQPFFFFY
jgi:hypothetical protein